jgi:hypothetical protein
MAMVGGSSTRAESTTRDSVRPLAEPGTPSHA